MLLTFAVTDGAFTIAGTDRSMPIGRVAQMSFIPVRLRRIPASDCRAPARSPPMCRLSPMAAISAVEIDPETGEVALDRYTVVDDIGTVINPLLAKGQIQGGVAQGAGQALAEDVVYDPDSGQLLTGTLLDYGIPRADTMPRVTVDFSPVPSTTNPLGAKGVGGGRDRRLDADGDERDPRALAPLGVTDVAMPAIPERIWRAIHEHTRG
jgi:carbon-monoxide dehydrogenase large subunit